MQTVGDLCSCHISLLGFFGENFAYGEHNAFGVGNSFVLGVDGEDAK